jgi:hypothetical protein
MLDGNYLLNYGRFVSHQKNLFQPPAFACGTLEKRPPPKWMRDVGKQCEESQCPRASVSNGSKSKTQSVRGWKTPGGHPNDISQSDVLIQRLHTRIHTKMNQAHIWTFIGEPPPHMVGNWVFWLVIPSGPPISAPKALMLDLPSLTPVPRLLHSMSIIGLVLWGMHNNLPQMKQWKHRLCYISWITIPLSLFFFFFFFFFFFVLFAFSLFFPSILFFYNYHACMLFTLFFDHIFFLSSGIMEIPTSPPVSGVAYRRLGGVPLLSSKLISADCPSG